MDTGYAKLAPPALDDRDRSQGEEGETVKATGLRDVHGPTVRALSVRVALAACAIVGTAYLVIAVAGAVIVTNTLTGEVDRNLAQSLAHMPGQAPDSGGGFQPPTPDRPFGAPVLVWTIHPDGTVSSQNTSNIVLPAAYRAVIGPETVSISGVSVRIAGTQRGDDYVVVGQTMENVSATQSTLVAAEIGIGAALLIVVFLGSVAIGRRVAEPVERARQRQLEFTADASHELRTPLSVIEAHTSLALAKDRSDDWYRSTFGRVDQESRRIRRIVDDMLWLARFDATRDAPHPEPVDLNVLAAQTADRFRVVAESRRQTLAVAPAPEGAVVSVAPEWLDRLVGVLLDNACKYSPDGGRIEVSVSIEGRRVRLAVDDSGPGIAPDERARIFDRFHRATDSAGGAGLGLAIADAIARASGGRWQIGESPSGGARIAITWPRTLAG